MGGGSDDVNNFPKENKLIPRSIVLPETQTRPQLVKKFPAIPRLQETNTFAHPKPDQPTPSPIRLPENPF